MAMYMVEVVGKVPITVLVDANSRESATDKAVRGAKEALGGDASIEVIDLALVQENKE